ncbi:MAG: hypothetical protein M4579_004156 [Chaenotheca gracillima]|nr:MAG: hypothetical protein M4579_004156 [Chaenotheca gracillima]
MHLPVDPRLQTDQEPAPASTSASAATTTAAVADRRGSHILNRHHPSESAGADLNINGRQHNGVGGLNGLSGLNGHHRVSSDPPPPPHSLPPPPPSFSDNPARLALPRPHTELPSLAESTRPYYYSSDQLPPSDPSAEIDPNDPNADPKRPRACEACRGLKVKCEPDLNDLEGACRRCAKAKRSCVVTAPNRKRQKKTDSRVAELEKKIDALTASLHANTSTGRPADSDPDHSPAQSGEGDHQSTVSSTIRGSDASAPVRHISPPRHGQDRAPTRTRSLEMAGADTRSPQPCVVAGLKRKHSADPVRNPPIRSPTVVVSPSPKTDPASEICPKSSKLTAYPFLMTQTSSKSPTPHAPRASPPRQIGPTPYSEYADVVDRKELTADEAARYFRKYVDEMAPHMPIVIFRPGTTASEIRRAKPILFLSILSIACGVDNPDLQHTLTKEIMKVLAEKVMVTGEKSLELIQALLVATIWYVPPQHYEDLKFYQMLHIAATIAIDLGMGRQSKPMRGSIPMAHFFKDHHPWRKGLQFDAGSLEARRTWLGIFFLCSNASISLRRPNLIRWSGFMQESVEVLESSAEAYRSDNLLCQFVRLQRVGEDISVQFSMDDPMALVGIADPKTQYALKGFENQFDSWSRHLTEENSSPALHLNSHIINLYMHEVAMHVDHNVDDFKPPFTEDALKIHQQQSGLLTATHISALSTCMSSIHATIDIFTSFDRDTVRNLPIFNFVRVAYSLVVLMKMHFAASVPNSELGKVIPKEAMKLNHYLMTLLGAFRAAAENGACRPAQKFMMVLVMLSTWLQKSENSNKKDGRSTSAERQALANSGGCPLALMAVAAKMDNDAQRNVPTRSTTQTPFYPPSMPNAESSNSGTMGAGIHRPPTADLSNANTPLQMLSEVAMGSQGNMTNGAYSATDTWYGQSNNTNQYNPNQNTVNGQDPSATNQPDMHSYSSSTGHGASGLTTPAPTDPQQQTTINPDGSIATFNGTSTNFDPADLDMDFGNIEVGDWMQATGMMSADDGLSELFKPGVFLDSFFENQVDFSPPGVGGNNGGETAQAIGIGTGQGSVDYGGYPQ